MSPLPKYTGTYCLSYPVRIISYLACSILHVSTANCVSICRWGLLWVRSRWTLYHFISCIHFASSGLNEGLLLDFSCGFYVPISKSSLKSQTSESLLSVYSNTRDFLSVSFLFFLSNPCCPTQIWVGGPLALLPSCDPGNFLPFTVLYPWGPVSYTILV